MQLRLAIAAVFLLPIFLVRADISELKTCKESGPVN